MSDVREAVRDRYGRIAAESTKTGCCGGDSGGSSCGTAGSEASPEYRSGRIGYSHEELAGLPEGANLGLGCGNPQAIAGLKTGESVLDLGSGAGIDCFLAARAVGASGTVIGVDMTPEMVSRARDNASAAELSNVDFRLGEIESLPVADSSVDVIMSNCVINLSPDKLSVFREAFRVLRPGGRLAISDIVATAPLPPEVRADLDAYTGCMAGAAEISEIATMLAEAGFDDIRVQPKDESKELVREWAPEHALEDVVVSATIEATRPQIVRRPER